MNPSECSYQMRQNHNIIPCWTKILFLLTTYRYEADALRHGCRLAVHSACCQFYRLPDRGQHSVVDPGPSLGPCSRPKLFILVSLYPLTLPPNPPLLPPATVDRIYRYPVIYVSSSVWSGCIVRVLSCSETSPLSPISP